jgi:hypothetical protein
MPNQNVLHLILLEEFVVDEQHRPAGIAETMLDLFFLQATHYNLCARQFHRVKPLNNMGNFKQYRVADYWSSAGGVQLAPHEPRRCSYLSPRG